MTEKTLNYPKNRYSVACCFVKEYLNSTDKCDLFASDRIEGLKCRTCEL